jgi:hypothetical protein
MAKATDSETKGLKRKKNKELIIKVRVNEEELKLIKEYAESYKSISDFIRFCCLKQNKKDRGISRKMEAGVETLIKEVNAVGKNVNQVARYVNFLEDNGITYAPSIERFNHEILAYTAAQIKIETLLKQVLKD